MTAESFWDFSVRTYRTPDVPEACLSLQNDYGADVNMILYCAWVAAAAGPFDDELFDRASGFSARWADNVVKRLRKARKWMKQTGCETEPVPTDACMEFREKIKDVEFAAEKMQQEALESILPSDRHPAEAPDKLVADVIANLMRYLAHQDIPANDDVRHKLEVIVRAAFPAFDSDLISRALAG